jgi:hypothetical protein
MAPRRPFEHYDAQAIRRFFDYLRIYPELRGPMVSAASALGLFQRPADNKHWLNIEVHIDGLNISPVIQNELLGLGFQIDGFISFKPSHFTDHFTLKFKVDEDDNDRVRELVAAAREAFSKAKGVFSQHKDVEVYIESELYAHEWRAHWPQRTGEQAICKNCPLSPGELKARSVPNLPVNGMVDDLQEERKRADIHLKLGPAPDGEALVAPAVSAGLYLVETWSGNRVLTAQFDDANSAIAVFRRLKTYFDNAPYFAELTLEFCNDMWRAPLANGELSPVPPICFL